MQWHTTSAASIYTNDRQNELRALANAAHREEAAEKRSKKANHLSRLMRRAKSDIRATSEGLTPVSDAC
jgi:hypothetical protein